MAGAMMFGAVGAAFGGRAKKKETRTVRSFLIISYLKDDNVEYIAFDVTGNIKNADRLVHEFRESSITAQSHTIEL